MAEKTCAERIVEHYHSRMESLMALWNAPENEVEEIGRLDTYGLCFDYVEANTFEEQPDGYFRYQLSWGGPSDEFRFFVHPRVALSRPGRWGYNIDRIEYVFMDWFDGAKEEVYDKKHLEVLESIFDYFSESVKVPRELEY